jgi:hypothetical protein
MASQIDIEAELLLLKPKIIEAEKDRKEAKLKFEIAIEQENPE